MNKLIKTISILSFAFIAAATAFAAPAVKDKGKKEFKETDAVNLVYNMKTGWNLGNTFDATGARNLSSEESWGMPHTTKPMIDYLAECGIKSIRIPVSWANHFIDDKYTIDPLWMKRVKDVVDWAIGNDMYVILNTHHDNYESNTNMPHCSGYYPSVLNQNETMLYTKNVWRQISTAFNNGYDEHLIFEPFNEPRMRGHSHEWYYNKTCNECQYAAQQINKMNQIALNTIRESKGNNLKRFVLLTGIAASPNSVLGDNIFKFPKDYTDEKINNNRFIISVHMYNPYSFAMQNPGETVFTESHKGELAWTFQQLNEKFIENGIPVIIGEYGATNKNNLEERCKWFDFFIRESRKYKITSCLWDNGQTNASLTYEEKFGFYNRSELTWFFPEIKDTIINAIKEED